MTTLLKQAGRSAGEADGIVAGLRRDFRAVNLDAADRAMLEYADKLTRTPWSMGEPDIQALRATGFDDRAIHDLCTVVAYFAFVNRIADGLGVELEAPSTPGQPGRHV